MLARSSIIRLATILAANAAAAGAASAQAKPSSGLALGTKVPPITLEALSNTPDGTSVSWESFGDKVVVLDFWGTW